MKKAIRLVYDAIVEYVCDICTLLYFGSLVGFFIGSAFGFGIAVCERILRFIY